MIYSYMGMYRMLQQKHVHARTIRVFFYQRARTAAVCEL